MPSGQTEHLKLSTFNSGEDGWAAAMNRNLRVLDSTLATVLKETNLKIAAVEQQIANRYIDLETSLQTQTEAYINNISSAQSASYSNLTDYFETVIQPTLETFLTDMNAITAQIQAALTAAETTRQETNSSISDMFDLINTQFAAVSAEIQSETATVNAAKSELQSLLDSIESALNTHVDNLSNPHEVDADQIGDLGDIIKYQEHEDDAAFL